MYVQGSHTFAMFHTHVTWGTWPHAHKRDDHYQICWELHYGKLLALLCYFVFQTIFFFCLVVWRLLVTQVEKKKLYNLIHGGIGNTWVHNFCTGMSKTRIQKLSPSTIDILHSTGIGNSAQPSHICNSEEKVNPGCAFSGPMNRPCLVCQLFKAYSDSTRQERTLPYGY